MIRPPVSQLEERLLVLTPTGRDAALTCALLKKASIECDVCETVTELVRRTETEGAAGLLIAEEVLTASAVRQTVAMIDRQESWSDIPIVMFTGQAAALLTRPPTHQLITGLGNVTLLDRPIRPITMISAAKAALRARRRQYHARGELLDQQDAVRQRDQFLAMLGHELRNPLGAITMAVELMKHHETANPRYQTIIHDQTQILTRLVDDLLDVSRMTSGKIVLQCRRIDLNALIERCVQAMATAIKTQRVRVTFARPTESIAIDADEVRIEQVVMNLLGNAIKYTPSGGRIDVSAALDNGQAVVAVRDTGVGIAPNMIGRVFDLFTQVESTLDRAKGGMGIGLTLVRSLIEAHGGSVDVASAGLGKGSVFTVRLPAVTERPASKPDESHAPTAPGRDVLLVEDNADVRDMMKSFLEENGHHVDAVADGITAVEHALTRRPSIMVVDIGLPGLDGYGVAQQVRESLGNSVYMVAVTGYGQPSDRRRALEAGFNVHLTKPVNVVALQQVIAGATPGSIAAGTTTR